MFPSGQGILSEAQMSDFRTEHNSEKENPVFRDFLFFVQFFPSKVYTKNKIYGIINAEILANASLWATPRHTLYACYIESGHKNALASKHFYL